MARIENWMLINDVDRSGKPYQKLVGTVYNHPRANSDTSELCDGHTVMTSKVVDIDWDKGVIVTQSGTVYELGVK